VCKIQDGPEENTGNVTFFSNIAVPLCYLPLAGGSGVLLLVEMPLDSRVDPLVVIEKWLSMVGVF